MTWPDPRIDFGRELYVPWQILEGRHLYVALAYHNGPLSPYLNSLWFFLFGTSLRTLVLCNYMILLATSWIVYRILKEISGRLGAIFASSTFLLLFTFVNFTQTGNENWLTPYSHEITHGISLSLLALFLFNLSIMKKMSKYYAGAAGFFLGLVFLTKCEVFAAAISAFLFEFILLFISKEHRKKSGGILLCFFSGFIAPPLVSYIFFLSISSATEALQGVLGSWMYVFGQNNLESPYFSRNMGFDKPLQNIIRLLEVALSYAAIFLCSISIALISRKLTKFWHTTIAIITFVLPVILLWFFRQNIPWDSIFYPLPLILAFGILITLFQTYSPKTKNTSLNNSHFLRTGLFVFAFILLLKIILKTRIHYSGFGLAMPATLLLVVLLSEWLPAYVKKIGGSGRIFAALSTGIWTGIIICYLTFAHFIITSKTNIVGFGADSFFADARGIPIQKALNGILEHVEPDKTLKVVPATEILNYLSRRKNPLRYGNLNPHQVHIFGEHNILQDFKNNPPDYIVLADDHFKTFGHSYFGQSYAQSISLWISDNYKYVAWLAPAPPFANARTDILLFERTEPPSEDKIAKTLFTFEQFSQETKHD
ncbi:MAG: glycosyltransferase family 39 protein [Proteobacteria bacterium]|nr:glycosyltransferase family 39 protein [Pseudomonadota bacterium]